MKVDINTVPAFYKRYVEHVKDVNLIEALQLTAQKTVELVSSIPEEKGEYRYATGKWSIKELLCHVMDAERIFAYRALRIARNDKTPLAGFDENEYAPQANAHARTLQQLTKQMERLRFTSVDLFNSFTEDMLQRTGTASNVEMSVINLGFIIAGHEVHHRQVLQERYLT